MRIPLCLEPGLRQEKRTREAVEQTLPAVGSLVIRNAPVNAIVIGYHEVAEFVSQCQTTAPQSQVTIDDSDAATA